MRRLWLVIVCLAVIMPAMARNNPFKKLKYTPPRFLRFTKNLTQWDNRVFYKTDIPNGTVYLEKNAFTYVLLNEDELARMHPNITNLTTLHGHIVKQSFVNANPTAITGADSYPDYSNYFIGTDPGHWSTHVPIYKEITYNNLYSNIDMRVYSAYNYTLKYDYILHPSANVKDIAVAYEGADNVAIKKGNLYIYTSIGYCTEAKPYAYQKINNKEVEIPCQFILNTINGNPTVTFQLGAYDKNYDVIIDPSLIFSTYTGSTLDNWGYTATYDDKGNMFLGGYINALSTGSTGYPTTKGAFQTKFQGGSGGGSGTGRGIGYSCDIGITKFNSTGSSLIYSTYLGGKDNETPHSLICDTAGNLYIYGVSYSTDFPVTTGCYNNVGDTAGDIIVVKMNSTGTGLLGSTYVGGKGSDGINYDPQEFSSGNLKVNYGDQNRGEVNIDKKGNVVVATCTKSSSFPTTAKAFQLSSGGKQDGVIFKLNNNLTSLLWASYVGGSSDDAAYSVEVADNNSLYIAGGTMSSNFTTTSGALNTSYIGGGSDGFICHISENGDSLLQSTYVGTTGKDQAYFVRLDKSQYVYFIGQNDSAYTVTTGVYNNPSSGQFISKVSGKLDKVIWSTVVGSGSGKPNISPTAFLIDTCENIYLAGWGTKSLVFSRPFVHDMTGMPLTSDAYQSTTDGTDFYIMILKRDAKSLLYATYFGGNGVIEHVDGGTSRFDKNGYIYEAICEGCGGDTTFKGTAGAYCRINSSDNCNELGFKFKLDVVKIKAASIPKPKATGCAPLTVNFTNKSVNATKYQWYYGDGGSDTAFQPKHTFTKAGTYSVMLIAFDPMGCAPPDTAYTSVLVRNTKSKAIFSLSKTDYCDSMVIVGIAIKSSVYAKLKWSVTGGFNSTNDTIRYKFTKPGTYTVRLIVTDTSVCNPQDTLDQTVVYNSKIEAHLKDTAFKACPVLKAFLSNASIGGKNLSWDFGDGTPKVVDQDTITHFYPTPGIYHIKITITDPAACNKKDSAMALVTVLGPKPHADFSLTPALAAQGDTIHFTNKSTGATSYSWDFGDGGTSDTTNPIHIYYQDDHFNVCLYATNNGCHDVICEPVIINTESAIGVPNAFSPNGDGHNDILYVRGRNYKSIDFKVFNRWGELVFETNSYDIGWNGTWRNDGAHPQEMDVYVWTLSGVTPQGKTIFRKGNVTLLR